MHGGEQLVGQRAADTKLTGGLLDGEHAKRSAGGFAGVVQHEILVAEWARSSARWTRADDEPHLFGCGREGLRSFGRRFLNAGPFQVVLTDEPLMVLQRQRIVNLLAPFRKQLQMRGADLLTNLVKVLVPQRPRIE